MSLTFLAPLVLLAVAAFAWSRPGRRPAGVPQWSEYGALAALGLALAGVLQLLVAGPKKLPVLEGALLFALSADVVNVLLALLVSFIGWVVVRFSRSYLDGEAQEGRFHALMLSTLDTDLHCRLEYRPLMKTQISKKEQAISSCRRKTPCSSLPLALTPT